MKTEKQIKEQLETVAACIKMPVSQNCNCVKKLKYKPSSMVCRKCILAENFINSSFIDALKALTEDNLEKAVNILSEVK